MSHDPLQIVIVLILLYLCVAVTDIIIILLRNTRMLEGIKIQLARLAELIPQLQVLVQNLRSENATLKARIAELEGVGVDIPAMETNLAAANDTIASLF